MQLKSLLIPALLGALALAGCNESSINDFAPNPNRAVPAKLLQSFKAKGIKASAPIMMRIIKDEHLLEVWKQKDSGRYDLIAAYNICAWAGKLGPKKTTGDRQAPEGFYTIRASLMNPNSKYFLSFDTGYPNAFDRSHGYTGANLMVHGACSSAGCYSMTDASVQEIFSLARDAFKGGQENFILQALPFRMTADKMARYSGDPSFPFWQMLKEGYDHFELTRTPPKVDVCEKKYVFNRTAADGSSFSASAACPPMTISASLSSASAAYQVKYEAAFAAARLKYADLPAPVVTGGKSRPLDKKWQPKAVSLPSAMAFAAPAGPRISTPLAAKTPMSEPASTAAETAAAYATAAAPAGDPSIPVPLVEEQETNAPVPVPAANPKAAAVVALPAPVKKKRWWPLGN
jgi:murein L,D-transpeptidase YafK